MLGFQVLSGLGILLIIFRGTAVCFKASEDFFTRFKNVAMGSLQYTFFLDSKAKAYPFVMNTRMYSIIFIRNDIPYRWRGRYNEDTILSLC